MWNDLEWDVIKVPVLVAEITTVTKGKTQEKKCTYLFHFSLKFYLHIKTKQKKIQLHSKSDSILILSLETKHTKRHS